MSKSIMNRRAYQLISSILLIFSISILVGQFSPVRAQNENESEDFFDQGEEEFDQEAETLEEPQKPDSKPLLTIDEEPPATEEGSSEESEVESLQPTEAETENMELQRSQQEQKLEQELNIGEEHPGKPKLEFAPNPNEGLELDDNEPYQPADEEVDVKF